MTYSDSDTFRNENGTEKTSHVFVVFYHVLHVLLHYSKSRVAGEPMKWRCLQKGTIQLHQATEIS